MRTSCVQAEGGGIGWTTKRPGGDGKSRYRACYRDARGRTRSAGTFSTKKDADRAWLQAELLLVQGRLGGADTGKLTFTRYVDEVWFPNHVLEPSTREGYRYSIDKHLKPTFGPMRMVDILPSHVREWVTERAAAGTTPATIRHNKIVLSAIFTTALNDQVTLLHPCRGVKTPTVPVKGYRIITPEQFEAIYAALPAASSPCPGPSCRSTRSSTRRGCASTSSPTPRAATPDACA